MAAVFSSAAGMVARVNVSRPAVPFKINFGQGTAQKFIVTQAAIEQQGNFQFLHTLQEMIYVYIFGDRIGELQVSGVAFAALCGAGEGSGMLEALDYYRTHRVAVRGEAIEIQFGSPAATFWGFLTGSRVEVMRPEVTMGQWAMRFHIVPPARPHELLKP